jgi:ectoine hydroxylase-related dioxygenase (phytanoyl-CoA dioxygenase family)
MTKINKFSENGYIVLKKAISRKLLNEIKKEIYKITIPRKIKHNFNSFEKITKKIRSSEFNFTKSIFERLFYKGFIEKILLENKLYNSISGILGKDLSFAIDPAITLNLPKKDDPKKNYLFKAWHQEIWSGASVNSIQIWTPLISKKNAPAKLEIMCNSHKWGHIPHRNRIPTELPNKYKTKTISLNDTDIMIFSTLLLHRSVTTNSSRLALPLIIKNFKIKDNSFLENRSWKIFSYSEITKIERYLGNHYLSPYRVLNNKTDLFSGTIKKK